MLATPAAFAQTPVALSASLYDGGAQIAQGLLWRIYAEPIEASPVPELVKKEEGGSVSFTLSPGLYVVHVSYGLASATKRLLVGTGALSEKISLDAGALRVNGFNGDKPLPRNRLRMEVFVPEAGNSEGRLVVEDLKAGQILRLPAGAYTLVSYYGDANAVVRANVRIDAGKISDISVQHRAAMITMKLVSEKGGEALADTSWSVLTPGGDVIRESIGAFPSVILTEGSYLVIARNDNKVFSHEFKVTSGLDQEVEVIYK